MNICSRVDKLPMYIFSELDDKKRRLQEQGIEIIDLSIGDPDGETPPFIVEAMIDGLMDKKKYGYPPYRGTQEFKAAVAKHYLLEYGVKLDAETEVATLIGSKEGIAHLILGVTSLEDYLILPDPSYPVYNASAIISGARVIKINLLEENEYLPKIDTLDKNLLDKAKMIIVNYPNNPTGAVANSEFYENLIALGKNHNIIIVNDGAYLDICNNDKKPLSILQTEGAKDIAVEFGSLSKSYNMSGWRLGYVVGNKDIINKLMLVKTNFDSGQFSPIQHAGATALENGAEVIKSINVIYEKRRALIEDVLKNIGLQVYASSGAFYIWFKTAPGYTSQTMVNKFLKDAGILITPGDAFGRMGEGYCRLSLTISDKKLGEVVKRISTMKLN